MVELSDSYELGWRRQEHSGDVEEDNKGVQNYGASVLPEIGEALKFREYLPVYSFKAACGSLAEGQEAEIEGWIKVEGRGKLDPTQFIVRTEGVSMEGLIPDGALCIMRKLGGGGLEGKTILVQRNDASDSESGSAYTIKTSCVRGRRSCSRRRIRSATFP